MKRWFKNPPTKKGLYWAKLYKHKEAQIVMVVQGRFNILRFQVIGTDETFDLKEALAWCCKRPMKPRIND